MKNRITHIITGLGNGGAEHSLYVLLQKSTQKKQKISVISAQNEGYYGAKIRELGIDLYCLNLDRSPQNFFLLLPKVIQKTNAEIIHGWMYHGNIIAYFVRLLFLPKAKLGWSIRHSLHAIAEEKVCTRWLIHLGAWLSRYPDFILFNSEISRRHHLELGYTKENSFLIPNGFDVEKYRPSDEERVSILNELSISEDSIIIGHVGRYHPDKGHQIFLDAILPLIAKDSNIHIVMAGRFVEYSNQSLASKISTHLISQVHLLGERQDVSSLMATMDIFIQSSRTEAFPNALGEAMSAGAACIATNVGDSSLILGAEELIVDRNDIVAIRKKTRKLIACGKDRKRHGQTAREQIMKNYPVKKMLFQYEKLYSKLLQPVNSVDKVS